jgi:hypothetical protein
MSRPGYDGVWRPEMAVNGRWIACRQVDLGPGLNRRYIREDDGRHSGAYFVGTYHDDQATCQRRCDDLNRGVSR